MRKIGTFSTCFFPWFYTLVPLLWKHWRPLKFSARGLGSRNWRMWFLVRATLRWACRQFFILFYFMTRLNWMQEWPTSPLYRAGRARAGQGRWGRRQDSACPSHPPGRTRTQAGHQDQMASCPEPPSNCSQGFCYHCRQHGKLSILQWSV